MKNHLLKIICCTLSFLSLPTFASITKFSSSDLVNKQSISCNFDKSNIDYQDFITTLVQSDPKNQGVNKHILKIKNYTVSDVSRFSASRLQEKEGYLNTHNLDINVRKYGLNVIRFSQFEGFYKDGQSFGYYFIIKGDPQANKEILKRNKIYPQYGIIEATQGGNTRLRCFTAG